MWIYLAGPWIERDKMASYASMLESKGHTITHRWWDVEDKLESDRTASMLRKDAENDIKGVTRADILVVINSAKSEGKAFEQGIAIANNKPVIAVGTRGEHSKNVFHYLPLYRWTPSMEGALEILDSLEWAMRLNDL